MKPFEDYFILFIRLLSSIGWEHRVRCIRQSNQVTAFVSFLPYPPSSENVNYLVFIDTKYVYIEIACIYIYIYDRSL